MSKFQEKLLTDYLVDEQARFYRLAYSYLKNREEALDAVQTAVCRAWERQDHLRDPDAMRTWFYRILVNVCTDMLRQRKRVTFVPPDALDAGSYEDPLPADGSLGARIDALPPRSPPSFVCGSTRSCPSRRSAPLPAPISARSRPACTRV